MAEEKTVLIVEDEKNIVDILRFNLERKGYRTLEAYDGEEGLRLARTEKPDLILLDIMLPKMIGFDVCQALRDDGDSVPRDSYLPGTAPVSSFSSRRPAS